MLNGCAQLPSAIFFCTLNIERRLGDPLRRRCVQGRAAQSILESAARSVIAQNSVAVAGDKERNTDIARDQLPRRDNCTRRPGVGQVRRKIHTSPTTWKRVLHDRCFRHPGAPESYRLARAAGSAGVIVGHAIVNLGHRNRQVLVRKRSRSCIHRMIAVSLSMINVVSCTAGRCSTKSITLIFVAFPLQEEAPL